MNYKDIVDLAIADLDEFFDSNHTSQITAETTTRRMISASGIDDGRKLLVERFLADTNVETLEQVLLCLLLTGHEMCHLMNNHNKRSDWKATERKALEMWADFFGARVTFCLLTHGKKTQSVIAAALGPLATAHSLPSGFSQERLLNAFGNVLDIVFAQFIKAQKSEKYPSASERMLTITAGVNSYFYREFGRLDENWTLFIYQKIAFGRPWFANSATEMQGQEMDEGIFMLINKVHKDISGVRASISPGLRPEYEKLIGTGYRNTERGRRLAAKAMQQEFSKWETDFGRETQAFLKDRYP